MKPSIVGAAAAAIAATGVAQTVDFSGEAIGAIAGAVVVIGQRSITDWITAALAVATAALLWRYKKLPEPVVVVAAALIGLLVHPLVSHA